MGDCPSCYSEWSKNRDKCKSCEFRVWCEESSKLDKGLGCFSYDDVSFSQTVAQEPEQWKHEQKTSPHKMLGELLHDLLERPEEHRAIIGILHKITALQRSSPLCFGVTLTKVLNPEMSYSDIAKRYNTSKQLVAHHLNRAKKLIPQLESAILVDRRRLPHLNGPKRLTWAAKSISDKRINCEMRDWVTEKYGSLLEFERIANIPHNSLSRWILGQNKPRHRSRVKLADALGLTIDEMEEQFNI